MKKLSITILILLTIILMGCTTDQNRADIVATTLPVYDFSVAICEGTGLSVGQLVTDSVSCLHDYSLSVRQMRLLRNADTVIVSGAGLEDFLEPSIFQEKHLIDASTGIDILSADHSHQESHSDHQQDPHIWLSPKNAKIMAQNIIFAPYTAQ